MLTLHKSPVISSIISFIILCVCFFCIQHSAYANEAERDEGKHDEYFSMTSRIGDDSLVAGEQVILENKELNGNVYAMGESIELRNITIKNDAFLYAEHIIFDENVTIQGNFVYHGDIEIKNKETPLENIVRGEISKGQTSFKNYSFMNILYTDYDKIIFLLYLTSVIFCSFFLYRYIPKYFANTIQNIRSKTLSSFLWGASFIITAPLIAFILGMTLIGFPLGIMLLSIWLLSLFLFPYLLASTGTALFLQLFQWKGFFATLVVTVLSSLIALMIFTSPILLLVAPFIIGAMILEKKSILQGYRV